MFNKIKKVFTVLAVLTLFVSSTPLNVLADVVSESTSEQASTGTQSEVSKTTDNTTVSSNTAESGLTSSSISETNESVGTSINANAPNEDSTDKESEKATTSEDIKEKNNASGLSSSLIEVANKYNVDAKKILDLSKRSGDAKYSTTGLSDDEVRVLGMYIFGITKSSPSDYAKIPNEKGEMVDIPFIYDGSRGMTSSTSFAMNYTLRHRTGATSNFNRIGRQYIDGHPAFCIDPQADFLDNRNYTQFVADNNSDWWNINSYIIFGDDSSDKNHGYLQLMIWEQLGWTVTGVGAPGSLQEYQNYRTAVKSTVENFKTKASFHGQTFEVKKGQTITPVDTNGVIQKMGLDPAYPVPAGIQLSGATNPIKITVPSNYSGPDTVEFHMLRGTPSGQFSSILRWEMPGNLPEQPVVTSGPVNPLYNDTMFRVHITSQPEDKNFVSFKKVDENGNTLSDARFKVTNLSTSSVGYETSNSLGLVTIKGTEGTKLKVEEITAPDGYIIDSTPKTITIDGSTNTYRFVNKKEETPPTPKYGYIYIYKEDEKGNKLPGAKFKIEYSNGYVSERTTDSSGMILLAGDPGETIKVTEVSAPDGYILSTKTETLTFSLDHDYSVTFVNQTKPKDGTLILKKVDAETGDTSQGKASLSGAVYTLSKKDGTLFKEITFAGTSATVSGIPFGEYVLKEKTAPKGYSLDTTEYPIVVAESTQAVIINKSVADTVIKGSIRGFKTGNKSSHDGTPNIKLSEVELTVTSKTNGKKYVTTTKEDGSFEINNLPYDDYTLTETKGKEGYRLIEPYNFSITAQGQVVTFNPEDKVIENRIKIVKKDKNTGKVIKVEGTQFKIWDKVLEKFVTDNGSEILTTNAEGYYVMFWVLLTLALRKSELYALRW